MPQSDTSSTMAVDGSVFRYVLIHLVSPSPSWKGASRSQHNIANLFPKIGTKPSSLLAGSALPKAKYSPNNVSTTSLPLPTPPLPTHPTTLVIKPSLNQLATEWHRSLPNSIKMIEAQDGCANVVDAQHSRNLSTPVSETEVESTCVL